jgi:hypothetical protein
VTQPDHEVAAAAMVETQRVGEKLDQLMGVLGQWFQTVQDRGRLAPERPAVIIYAASSTGLL